MLRSVASPRGFAALLRGLTVRSPGCPLPPLRPFSASPRASLPGSGPPLRLWDLAVDPFSSVRAQLPCSVSVQPLDPHGFPEADRAFVSIRAAETGAEAEPDPDRVQVRYDEQSKELLISSEGLHSNMMVEIVAPIKSNLYISTQGKGDVHVKQMECDVCKVQTEEGNCLLHSVKAHRVEVRSHAGDITGSGTIHGNVDLSTGGDSAVDVKKLQGTTMSVSTQNGPVRVRAIYAESSHVSSSSGRVELGNVHGDTAVRTLAGDVVVDGSNSLLKVSSCRGAIDVYVGDGGGAEVHSEEGPVCVRVPPSLAAGLELRGASVEIGPDVPLHTSEHSQDGGLTTVCGHMNGDTQAGRWVRARADRGPVTVRTQSWIESLKLGS